ncbi:MAG: diguanylate cyclase/phosphodiesterase, partial [Marinobacter sp. T13-3]
MFVNCVCNCSFLDPGHKAMAGKRGGLANAQQGAITLQTLLLLFTGTLLVALLLAAFVTSYGYFRDYVADQLKAHAQDGATATGLSLSNAIDGTDPVASSSLIDAVFDSGQYLMVEYVDHDGAVIAGRTMALRTQVAPEWFLAIAELPLPMAEAEVVRGWSRLGKVRVVSHPGRAYDNLWRITMGLFMGLVVIGGIGLLSLFIMLRWLLRPLKALEAQAHALSQRNFSQRIHMRSTRELNRVTAAMNQMADDLGRLFLGQGKLIQHLRKVNNEDPVTGLASRLAFDQRLKVEVESEEKAAPGVLMLIQLGYFADYSHAYGQQESDELLQEVAGILEAFVSHHVESFAGRRTGAEFAVFLPGASLHDAHGWASALVQELEQRYAALAAPMDTMVWVGLAPARPNETIRELLAAADEALLDAREQGESGVKAADAGDGQHHDMEAWRKIIVDAIRHRNLSMWLQPMVRGEDRQLVHYQVFSRIRTPEGDFRAGLFLPVAERLGLVKDVDRLLVASALDYLREHPGVVLAISLGRGSVADAGFRDDLLAMLDGAGYTARRLWVGVPELAMSYHRNAATALVMALYRSGVPVLVDRFGVGGVPFSYLKNLPFGALRIDNSFIHELDGHADNRFWLESVIGIARSRGVRVFATGVETAAEYSVLCELGIDGAMGYHLGRPF